MWPHAGFEDVRFSHGFVFQHLLREPMTVGALARAMGVTQQRASKAAAELEELGYVRREVDPADARVRRLVLTARGHGAVAAARLARAARRGRAARAPRRAPRGGGGTPAARRPGEMGAEEMVRARRVRLPS